MNILKHHVYYIYILTNPGKTMLYTGFTNSLTRRLEEHESNKGEPKTFAGRHYCHQLIYFEMFDNVNEAIAREKQIKRWSRKKKENLIDTTNPNWHSLNINFINVEE